MRMQKIKELSEELSKELVRLEVEENTTVTVTIQAGFVDIDIHWGDKYEGYRVDRSTLNAEL